MSVKLLRPAGYSLLKRWDEIGEGIMLSLMGLVVLGGGFGMATWAFGNLGLGLLLNQVTWDSVRNHPKFGSLVTLFLFSLASVFGSIYLVHYTWRQRKECLACRLGLRGEQAVGEALLDPRVLNAGYRSFHDIPGDGEWNLDHVVIGPGGVLVLETKARTKRPGRDNQAPHEVLFDGEVLRFPTWDDFETVRQVQRNAEWLQKLLADYGPKELPIQPVVVIPGWFVTTKGNYAVKAMNTTYLPTYLAGLKRRFTDQELKPLVSRLDERCRTLDF